MIPRKLFWFIDTAILLFAFYAGYLLTKALAPWRKQLVERMVQMVQQEEHLLFEMLRPEFAVLPPITYFSWILLVIVPVALFTLVAMDAYAGLRYISRTKLVFAGPVAVTMGLAAGALLILALHIPNWSRFFLLSFSTFAALGLTSLRIGVRVYHNWQATAGYYTRNVLAVGSTEVVPVLLDYVRARLPQSDYRVIGYLEVPAPTAVQQPIAMAAGAPRMTRALSASGEIAAATMASALIVEGCPAGSAASQDRPITAIPRFGAVDEINSVLVHRPVNEVIAASPLHGESWTEGESWMEQVLHACDDVGVPVRVVPQVLLTHRLLNLTPSRDPLETAPSSILLAPRYWNTEALQVKRLIDIVGSAMLLVVLAPLFALLAILIRLSGPGPIIYKWRAIGRHGRPFVGYKFRTMVANAEGLKTQLLKFNEMQGPVFKMTKDPRVTRVGRWLRKYSLDELPQLWSVLKGDMSLVGPRPPLPIEVERYEFWQMRKLSIRPGITCLWQVRGRNKISSFHRWAKLDLKYIDNWSLWLDVKILLWTVVAVLKGTGR